MNDNTTIYTQRRRKGTLRPFFAKLKYKRYDPSGELIATDEFRVLTRRYNGMWEACLPAFSLANQGETEQEAVRSLCEGLGAYLDLSFDRGLSFEEAKRPVSWPALARTYFQVLVSKVRR